MRNGSRSEAIGLQRGLAPMRRAGPLIADCPIIYLWRGFDFDRCCAELVEGIECKTAECSFNAVIRFIAASGWGKYRIL